MKEMQFVALVLMTLLTMKLLVLPRQAASNPSISKSRWLLAGGTALLGVQFLLQYRLGLRALGVTQAVLLNLTLFIPCTYLFALAVLHLQRQEHIWFWDKFVGLLAWVVVLILLGAAAAIDGQPLLSDTSQLRHAELVSSGIYLVMQAYYTWRSASLDAIQHFHLGHLGHDGTSADLCPRLRAGLIWCDVFCRYLLSC